MDLTRRGLLSGILLAAAGPAIIRAASLMPIKVMPSHFDLEAMLARNLAEKDAADGWATGDVWDDRLDMRGLGPLARGYFHVDYALPGAI